MVNRVIYRPRFLRCSRYLYVQLGEAVFLDYSYQGGDCLNGKSVRCCSIQPHVRHFDKIYERMIFGTQYNVGYLIIWNVVRVRVLTSLFKRIYVREWASERSEEFHISHYLFSSEGPTSFCEERDVCISSTLSYESRHYFLKQFCVPEVVAAAFIQYTNIHVYRNTGRHISSVPH
jgi:hypothetical protein